MLCCFNIRMKDKIDKNINEDIQDDVVFEEDTENGSASDAGRIKKLRDQLKECQKEKQEYLDGWQRARADLQNFKKDQIGEREKITKFAQEDLLYELLSVTDSFTMAFANKEAWEKVDTNWRTGVEYIYAQLKGVLERNGITEIEPLGEKFDPGEHTSIEAISTDDAGKDETVVEVVQNGYRLNGKVIRPARVRVAQYKKSG